MWYPGWDSGTEKKNHDRKTENTNKTWILVIDNVKYWFINFNKYIIQMQDINKRRNWVGGTWELCVQSSQFFCRSKTVLTYSLFTKNKCQSKI